MLIYAKVKQVAAKAMCIQKSRIYKHFFIMTLSLTLL